MNGNLNSLLEDLMDGSKQDLIAIDNDLIYQITTSDNQNNNAYNNISTVNLGDCERKLRDTYHINDSLPLIILKVDYYKPGLLIPVIGYEVYDPINKTQLNLNLCKDKLVKLNIPVSINEDKVYKHDPYSDYYNDECSVYTTDNGTDILINDRQNEYIENNYSLCENNCTFNGYDQKTKKALCECETKPSIGLISNIIKDEDVLSNDFNTTDDTNSNIDAMKCIDTLFSKEGLLTNIGSYILLLSFGFLAVSTFVFYKCGYHFIETSINDLIKLKNNKKKKVLNSIKDQKSIKKLKKKKKKKKKLSNPIKKKSKNTIKIYDNKEHQQITSSKFKTKSIDINLDMETNKMHNKIMIKKSKTKTDKSNNNNFQLTNYNHSELNSFNYEMALKHEFRTFSQIYVSFLMSKHVILFSFYPIIDYNIKIIKITLFFLSFDIYFAINGFFFDDKAIHQIYEDGGQYNFSYFMPKILLSFIISYIIIFFIRYASLSERFLIRIRNEEDITKITPMVSDSKRCLVIKYIIFYVLSFIFLIILWYYLSSFCAVYQNSQFFLIVNSFISFVISIIFPLIYNLIPSLIRVYSLKAKNECLYKTGIILQLF